MDLIINSTFETPSVRFIESNGNFLIKGRIIPTKENAFWGNVHNWVSSSLIKIDSSIELTIELDYINAYSITELLTLISSLKTIKEKGLIFSINWVCDEDENNELHLIGQDIASTISCPFIFVKRVKEL
jgi:hypothetical protein